MKNRLKGYQKGFTLLEMLLVITMIAILAGIVIVAINPGRQLAQARNVVRASDLRAIHSAVNQFYIEKRDWPEGMPTTLQEICDTGAEPFPATEIDCAGLFNLSMLVPTYISAIPSDPQGAITALTPFIKIAHAQAAVGTGYQIAVNPTTQMVILHAPKSTEYGLDLVAIGDVASVTAPCNNPILEECWSTTELTLNWGPMDDTTGATDEEHGKVNQSVITGSTGPWDKNYTDYLTSNYPAFAYCEYLNHENHKGFTDWYLPAIDQLENAINAQVDGTGTVTEFADYTYYWSSTESTNDFAFNVYYQSNTVFWNVNNKDYASSVRCFR